MCCCTTVCWNPPPRCLDGADLLHGVQRKHGCRMCVFGRQSVDGASMKPGVRRKRVERAWTERQAGRRVRGTGRARETGACWGEAEIRVQKQCPCRIIRRFTLQVFEHQPSLTPELSRPAARRQSSTNIPEKFAAVKQGRLGRIVRPAPDVFAGTAASMANLPLERLDDIDLIPAVRGGMRSEFASMAATQRGERPGAGTCGTCLDGVPA